MDGGIENRDAMFRPLNFPALGPRRGEPGLFDAVFEESESGLLVLDLDLSRLAVEISDANPAIASWLGMSRTALKGSSLFDLIAENDGAAARLRRATARHASDTVTVDLRCADGSILACSATIRPVSGTGARTRMLFIARRSDLSLPQALKAVEHERDAAMLSRERLLSRISHDLRTPLNGILGFAEMMTLMPDCTNGRHKGYASDIFAAGRELLSRVEDLLAAAECLGPEPRRRPELLALPKAVHAAVSRASKAAEAGAIALIERNESGLPPFYADADEIARMIDAALGNALRAAPAESAIVIGCRLSSRGELVLGIEDRGPPIELAEIEAAATLGPEPSEVYRSPHSRTVGGLPITRFLAARNGGRMTATGMADGGGFRLELFFPAHYHD